MRYPNGIPYIDVNTYVSMWFDVDNRVFVLKRGEMTRTYNSVWQMEATRDFFKGNFPEEGNWQKWYKAGRYIQEEMISDFMFQWCHKN